MNDLNLLVGAAEMGACAMPKHNSSIHFLSCAVLSGRVLSRPFLSCLVLSCLVLSCLVLSCLVLSCLVLSVSFFPSRICHGIDWCRKVLLFVLLSRSDGGLHHGATGVRPASHSPEVWAPPGHQHEVGPGQRSAGTEVRPSPPPPHFAFLPPIPPPAATDVNTVLPNDIIQVSSFNDCNLPSL